MALSLTFTDGMIANGRLRVEYDFGDGGGPQGREWAVNELRYLEPIDQDMKELLLRLALRWARQRGLTPDQLKGRTVTFDPSVLANVLRFS